MQARGAKLWAAITFGLVVVQVTLGFSITDMPYLGLIHGANALAVVAAASVAALRVGADARRADAPAEGATPMPSRRELLRRVAVGVAVTTALGAGALAWSSTLLGEYSVMDMGERPTEHGGPRGSTAAGGDRRSRGIRSRRTGAARSA